MNKAKQAQITKLVKKVTDQMKLPLKAPIPIEKLVEKMGIQICYEELDSDLSGLIYKKGDRAVIGVNSRDNSFERKRFTIAHELGHFLLHQSDDLRVDRNDYEGTLLKLRNNLSAQGIDDDEIEANSFAAEILMPGSLLNDEVKKAIEKKVEVDKFIEKVSKKFKVSTEALRYRLINLGYIR